MPVFFTPLYFNKIIAKTINATYLNDICVHTHVY